MSPVERSLEATVFIDIEPELNINLKKDPTITTYLSDKLLPVYINPLYDLVHIIRIDLDNIPETEEDPSGVRFKIFLPIIFGKSVSGRKKTYGKTSLVITNNIRVSGISGLVDTAMPYPLGDTEG